MSANPLAGKKILLGVSGGIAAYKAVFLARLLMKAEAEVRVVMTAGATNFVGPMTFQAITGNPVFTNLFDLTQESEIGHIEVADKASLVLIAPATANTLARLSAGLANDPLAALVLATRAPVLLAPSMNVNMWDNAITRENLVRLKQRGMTVVDPESGFLACRWTGPGRLAEPSDIVEAAARVLSAQDYRGKKIVVSAGPTCEDLDPVRFISNRSTGKMGFALARAAWRRGAQVVLISGPVSIDPVMGVEMINIRSAEQMEKAVLESADGADAVIMAAAVANFRPAACADQKLKQADMGKSMALEPTQDILCALVEKYKDQRSRPCLVGFAAETTDVLENARKKLHSKGCDLVCANDVSRVDAGFAVDTNEITLVTANGETTLPHGTKDESAHGILDAILSGLKS